MGHTKIIVDHEKIEYRGPFDANDLFRHIDVFTFEKGFDKRQDKDIEINTQNGKFIEWQVSPWKKITDYIRYIIKVRVIVHDLVKIDAVTDRKKSKIDSGKVLIVIDAFMEFDYDSYWDGKPMLFFLRTIYDYFVFKAYTERFEQRLAHDVNHLHDTLERFFNMYRNYSVTSKVIH